MPHLVLSLADVRVLRTILEAKHVDLRREIAHTDSRRFRQELHDIESTVERLLDQISDEQISEERPQEVGNVNETSQRRSRSPQRASEPEERMEGQIAVPESVTHYLTEHDVSYSVIHHRVAYTAAREAAAAHVPGREWAKAVVCMADGQPTLAVVPAHYVVDMHRLRELTGAKHLRLATEGEIASLYRGCELGAMPPLGPLYGQHVFVDTSMVSNAEIAFCAGSHGDAIRMRYRDFERLVKPTVAQFGRMH